MNIAIVSEITEKVRVRQLATLQSRADLDPLVKAVAHREADAMARNIQQALVLAEEARRLEAVRFAESAAIRDLHAGEASA